MQNVLSIEQHVSKSVNEVLFEIDYKKIIREQIEKEVARIISIEFGHFSNFEKILKDEISNQIKINFDNLSIPNFNNLTLSVVEKELNRVAYEEKERIEESLKLKINNLLGVKDKPVDISVIIDTFILNMYDKYIRDCSCYELTDNEVLEYVEDETSNFNFILEESTTDYGSFSSTITHFIMEFTYKSYSYAINIFINKVTSDGESGKWKSMDLNNYKILGININGKSIIKEGVLLSEFEYEFETMIIGCFINGNLIHISDDDRIEFEEK